MKKIFILLFSVLLFLGANAQTKYAASVQYGAGVPTYTPSVAKKESTKYQDNLTGLSWSFSSGVWYAQGKLRQSAAPTIVSGINSYIRTIWEDSDDGLVYSVNSAGTAWAQIGGGGGGAVTIDAAPTDGSTNAVSSNGVFDALALKLTTPTGTTAKGDVIVYNGTAWVKLPVGTNNQQLIADNTAAEGIKWVTPVAGGLSMGRIQSNGADIRYLILSGTPVVTFSKSGGVGTVSVTGGTVQWEKIQVDLNTATDVDASSNFSLNVNGLQASTMVEYPLAIWIDTKGFQTPNVVAHTYRNQGSAPVMSVTAGAAGSSITLKSVSGINAIGSSCTMIVKF